MNTAARSCPALLVSAPASGQGKTTVTAALAHYHRKQGRSVRVFKSGADFLDPMILARASGHPVYQLDLWMGSAAHCRQLLFDAAAEADLILVEGAMGLFDGAPSSADLAALFDIPVLALIDAGAMAQTFGAVAHGLATYRPGLPFAGVLANRVASPRHAEMLLGSLPPGLASFGALFHDSAAVLPDRHLGLVQAEEVADLDMRLAQLAEKIAATGLRALPPAVAFAAPPAAPPVPRLLAGLRIAVARDAAFSFLYSANLDVLRAMGAELRFFSPLADAVLPDADSLYLPGGYPELHLERLQGNAPMRDAIRAHHALGKPVLAECGGMLYLLESLTDAAGQRGEMAGLLPGHAVQQQRLAALALQAARLPEGELRGHTFHHTRMESGLRPLVRGTCPNGGATAEAVFRDKRLTASYIHAYFPSNLQATAALFLP